MAHLNLARWRLDRRHALRGLGATLFLPLLDGMRAPEEPPAGGDELPRRAVFVYLPNGVNVLDWQVTTAGRDYDLTEPLVPLERHRADLTVLSGLHHPHGLGLAHRCGGIWLTGADIGTPTSELRNTISADQRLAEHAGHLTRFPSLELTATEGTLAWTREGVSLPAERRCAAVFERLFGAPPGGVAGARRTLARRASVLDLVLEQARGLRGRLGSEDRSRLDEYLGAVREVERRTLRADRWLEAPPPAIEPDLRERLTRALPEDEAGLRYRTTYELIALALRTDATRVVTFLLGSESLSPALPEIGIPKTRHELSHHNGIPENLRALTRADTFHVARLAELLDLLAAHEERGERLLDRTLVLFGSGMSYGHGHGNANLPTLLLGGRALGLAHGAHVDFELPTLGARDLSDVDATYRTCLQPVDGDARLADLLLTVLQRLGVPDERFADSLRPLTELTA